MRKKIMIAVFAVTIIILAACGSTPEPSLSSIDVQNTAMAGAWTIVAQTQAAMPPTATQFIAPSPIPPSPMPQPTFTPWLMMPTPDVLFPSPTMVNTSSTKDPCSNAVLGPPATKGQVIKALIFKNLTKYTMTISIYLALTVHGECGYRSFQIPPRNSATFTDLPLGCYSVWAWTDKINIDSWSDTCFRDPGHKSTFEINEAVIKWKPP